jgi:NADPH:quinone reductase-like Zn-dependent oxidoreductase
VTGAAGFYGSLVIQLAIAEGIRVIADAAPKDEALVRSFGVTDIVPRGDDVAQSIRALIPEGVDGLADGSVQKDIVVPAIKDGGGIALVRGWEGEPGRGITPHPILVSLHAKETAKMADLVKQVENGTLQIRIAEIFTPEDAARAHQILEAGGLRGRLVIDLS